MTKMAWEVNEDVNRDKTGEAEEMNVEQHATTAKYRVPTQLKSKWLTGRKSGNFYTPLYLWPPQGVTPLWRCLIKLEWLGYHVVKKLWQYRIPESNRQMDGQTGRIAISILHEVCWCTIKIPYKQNNSSYFWSATILKKQLRNLIMHAMLPRSPKFPGWLFLTF